MLRWKALLSRLWRTRADALPAILTLLVSSVALGQAIPQFSTVEPHQYDTINLATLGIQLNVPVRSKAGAGGPALNPVVTSELGAPSFRAFCERVGAMLPTPFLFFEFNAKNSGRPQAAQFSLVAQSSQLEANLPPPARPLPALEHAPHCRSASTSAARLEE